MAVHQLLEAALDAAALEPVAPHGGVDANPQLGSFGQLGAALFVADAIASQVPRTERKRFEQWVGLARAVYAGHARGEGTLVTRGTKTRRTVLSRAELKSLSAALEVDGVVDARTDLSPALTAANTALFAAHDAEVQAGGPWVGAAMKRCIAAVVRALPLAQRRGFVDALDQCLLREELRGMLARRGDERCALVTRCLWRAAAGRARGGRAAGAQVSHWLGELADGRLVLVLKLGARWEVVAGARDEVLAHVPDAHLAAATRAAFEQ